METINGEWIMMGCNPDDPQCIHNIDQLKELIGQVGFLPLFAVGIPGFSVEERTVSSDWWTDDLERDPWVWRQILSRDPEIAYGKFFDRKAGFISKEWFPVFANYRRNGYDFDALCNDGLVPYRNRKLMEAFEPDEQLNSLELLSFEAKQRAGFGKDGQKNFEGVLTELQTQTYLIMSDFRQKQNKRGQKYGWHIAALETPETKWGYDYIASGYQEDPSESWRKITEHIKHFFPDTDEHVLQKQLGIRYPGETVSQHRPRKELLYPDNLLQKLGVEEKDLPLDDDRAEGLRQALEKLNTAEREVIQLHYEEHMTIPGIAERFQIPAARIRLVHDRAVRKLKKPEVKQLYMEGLVRSLIREEAEKEQKARSFLDRHYNNEDKETILQMSVYDLGLSTGVTNALIRAGINTVEDILLLMAERPKRLKRIRNLGEKGRHDLLEKLGEYGVHMGKALE